MYLKHFTDTDLNAVKVEAVEVPQNIVDSFVGQFKQEFEKTLEMYQSKKEVLDKLASQVQEAGIEVESFKHYGRCDAVQIMQKRSAFVNRFIGKASAFE